MVKNNSILYWLLAGCFVVFVGLGATKISRFTQHLDESDVLPSGVGSAEDKDAQINYELMRLVDPKTGKLPPNIRQLELDFVNRVMKTGASSSQNWSPRGPFNIGGRTRAMAVDVDDENVIIAGGVTGGVWRSTDGGQSFTLTTSTEQLHSVDCIVQDTRPGKHNIWYYGTGEHYAVISPTSTSGSGNGIYKSIDGGKSWQPLASTVAAVVNYSYNKTGFNYVWKMVIDPNDNVHDVIFAAVINGIYRSIDGGSTWQAVLGLDTTQALSEYSDVAITSTGILYAYINGSGTHSGIWRSSDQGNTWKSITPSAWSSVSARAVIAITPQDENKLFIIANTPNTGKNSHSLWHYTYLSGDGSGAGGYWDNRTTHLPAYVCQVFYNFKFGLYSTQDGYDMCMVVSPADSNMVLIGGTNIYRSIDGFTSDVNWHWIGGYRCDSATPSNYVYPHHHPDQHNLFFSRNDPNKVYSSNDGGIFKTLDITPDSIDWISLNNGYINSQFYTVDIDHGNSTSNKIVGGMQDNGSWMTFTENQNIAWKNVLYGDGGYCAIPKNRDYLILSWEQGKVLKCKQDSTGAIVNKTRIDPTGGGNYLFIAPFMLDPSNNNKMYLAAGAQLYVQSNLDSIPLTGDEYHSISTGWKSIPASNVGSPLLGNYISCLTVSAADSTFLYYGTNNGRVLRLDSLNGHVTQVNITSSIMPVGAYVSCIWVNPADATEAIVTFSNYNVISIFRTTDKGSTWQNISGNLEQNPDGTGAGPAVFWVDALNMHDSIVYFAATSAGLFATSTLNGTTTQWHQEGLNTIGNTIINMVKTRDYDGFVVAGTHGAGVFATRYKDVTSIAAPKAKSISISVNVAPNPSSSKVTFNFALDGEKMVTVQVYGVDGKLVKSINNELQTGMQSISWQVDNVANGLYLYEISIGNQHQTGKIIISH